MTFEELNLIKPLLNAVKAQGYTEPSPIQRKAIPPLLENRDLIGCAQTGTGKTAAFALPMLQILSQEKPSDKIRALILTPTRELALQIYESFVAYGANLKLRSTVIFGGVGQNPQVVALKRGVDILVATPGRLNDLIGQGYVDLSRLEIFVLDEADRMLDMGFIQDVKRVLRHLPAKRQTLLFSATMPMEIEYLAKTILTDPVTVKVDPVTSTVEAIRQSICFVDKNNKKYLLRDFLKSGEVKNALVFTRTKHGANRVVKELEDFGVRAMAIHGNKSQTARQEALAKFKSGKLQVLVATDIAARGIDVPELSHVFNYDLPNEPETYIHRIGRTGRAGLGGDAISFCCMDEMEYYLDIEKLTGQRIPMMETNYPMSAVQGGRPASKPAPRKAMPSMDAFADLGVDEPIGHIETVGDDKKYGRIDIPGQTPKRGQSGQRSSGGGQSRSRGGGNRSGGQYSGSQNRNGQNSGQSNNNLQAAPQAETKDGDVPKKKRRPRHRRKPSNGGQSQQS